MKPGSSSFIGAGSEIYTDKAKGYILYTYHQIFPQLVQIEMVILYKKECIISKHINEIIPSQVEKVTAKMRKTDKIRNPFIILWYWLQLSLLRV